MLAAGTFLFLRWMKGSDTTARIYFLKAVNTTLEGAINRALQVTLEQHLVKPAGHGSVEKFQRFQDELACLLEASDSVQDLHSPNSCPSITDHRSWATYASLICNGLDSKRLLLIGPSLTFGLHNHILSSISRIFPTSPSHPCLGPEFCTFHHICFSPSVPSSQHDHLTIAKKLDRHLKPPSPRDLFLTHSSLMSYIQSSSLYPGHNRDDLVYTTAMVDPGSGVRVKEVFWLGPARRADLIVLNRGPIQAPAWTYDGSSVGNWSFVDSLPYLPLLATLRLVNRPRRDLRALSIMNAAMTVTITKFIPEVLQTLQVLRSDTGVRLKPIIWHGSLYRFRRSQCEYSRDDAEVGKRAEEYLATILERRSEKNVAGNRQTEDPWGLYHDTQGNLFHFSEARSYNEPGTVYMQERILQSLLPHWNITFLPLDVSLKSSTKSNSNTGRGEQPKGRRHCAECCREEESAVGEKFLAVLGFLLDKSRSELGG